MNAKKLFRTVSLAALVVSFGLAQFRVARAGDASPGPRGAQMMGDASPGPRGGASILGDASPGPRGAGTLGDASPGPR
jgi:hypothetical protein